LNPKPGQISRKAAAATNSAPEIPCFIRFCIRGSFGLVLSRLRSGLSTHLGSLSFKGQGAFATQRRVPPSWIAKPIDILEYLKATLEAIAAGHPSTRIDDAHALKL
jgi:hypothetical protein